MTRMYERDPLTTATEIDDEMFLVKPGVEDIHHLDQVASGIWRFLGLARSLDEIQSVLEEAFPEVPAPTLRDDLARALDGMIDAGFVRIPSQDADEANAEIG